MGDWRQRIIGQAEASPDWFLANEDNWRRHPQLQQQALSGLLEDIGWLQRVIVNQRSGEEWPEDKRGIPRLLDGHLRVILAGRQRQSSVPYDIVDLSPEEERLALATLDPIGAIAERDELKLEELLEQVQSDDEAVQTMLSQLLAGPVPGEEDRLLRDRSLVEIDLEHLPVRPQWALLAIPFDKMPEVALILDQLSALGVTVELSDV